MKRALPLLLLLPGIALAADHAEAPAASSDPAADIADFYAWHQGDKIVAVVSVAPFTSAGGDAIYDADVLYTIHMDKDGDFVSDHDIHLRFGQNDAGDWGFQVTDLPGADESLTVGAVETTVDAGGGAMVYAGLRDDPFFFDATGFGDTLATGTLSFTATDGIAGLNVTALVLEFPYASVVNEAGTVRMWTTTSRLGA